MTSDDDPMRQALEIYFAHAQRLNHQIETRNAVPSEMVRNTALSMAQVLVAYTRPTNWSNGHGPTPKTPLPPQLAAAIERHIQILCGGHIPQWMLHLQKRGTVPVDPRIREWQGLAVAYVKLCKDEVIVNKAPVAYVAKIYGVDRRTVQNWIKALNAEPNDFFPQAMNQNERAELIAAKLIESGANYKAWGPGPQNANPFGKGRKRLTAKRSRI